MGTENPCKKDELYILIIGNEEECSLLKKNITRPGHNVLMAESYSEAIKKVAETCFDLIVMDIDLPDWDGEEIISRIKEMVGEINIVTMTNNNNREREQRVRDQRILYYAVKPLEYNEIRSIIDHLSSKKKANRKGE